MSLCYCRFEVWHISFKLWKPRFNQFSVLILFKLRFITTETFICGDLALNIFFFFSFFIHMLWMTGLMNPPWQNNSIMIYNMTVWGHALSLIFLVWHVVWHHRNGAGLILLSNAAEAWQRIMCQIPFSEHRKVRG